MNLKFFRWAPQQNKSNATHPSPRSLVFLHGMGGTGAIWRSITVKLEETFDCIAPDQRGHGNSRPVPMAEAQQFHAEDYAADVANLLDDLEVKRPLLIGHSMGVRTALALAKRDPEKASGIIAVDIGISTEWGGGIGLPLADFLENLPTEFSDRTRLREYLFTHCPDPAIAQYLAAVSKKISDAPETWVFPFDHQSLVQTIHQAEQAPLGQWLRSILDAGVPVLFLRGESSKVWLKEDYEKQKIEFQHPFLQFEEWENCGHGLPFEQRSRFVTRIQAFLPGLR